MAEGQWICPTNKPRNLEENKARRIKTKTKGCVPAPLSLPTATAECRVDECWLTWPRRNYLRSKTAGVQQRTAVRSHPCAGYGPSSAFAAPYLCNVVDLKWLRCGELSIQLGSLCQACTRAPLSTGYSVQSLRLQLHDAAFPVHDAAFPVQRPASAAHSSSLLASVCTPLSRQPTNPLP